MQQPKIILGCGTGYHNDDLEKAQQRLRKAKVYQDLSTVILVPTRGTIPAFVVQSWMFLMTPANQRAGRLFCQGLEVGDAYNAGITTTLADPGVGDCRYLLTLEDDNVPPPDGLLKLIESICDCDEPCKEHYAAVGGLYWSKGEDGFPMLFGDPKEEPLGFRPQVPQVDAVQEVNGVAMGFTLFHMGVFRDPTLFEEDESGLKNWFKTTQTNDGTRAESATQDLYFMRKLRRAGYRVACDTRVKVGHFDRDTEDVW